MNNAVDLRKIDPDLKYPLDQVAEFLNLSYGSILKLKKNGSFEGITRIGRRYYLPGWAILKFVQTGSTNK